MSNPPFHFLLPAHPMKPKLVEEIFADQQSEFEHAGYTTSLCPDSVLEENKPLRNIPEGSTVVYRGWMLNADAYQ